MWFAIARNPNTNMFAPGAFQDSAVLETGQPPLNIDTTGQVSVEVTQVTDPFDTSGLPIAGPDGGVTGSIEGTFTARFGNDPITGSFSSPVCSVTDLV